MSETFRVKLKTHPAATTGWEVTFGKRTVILGANGSAEHLKVASYPLLVRIREQVLEALGRTTTSAADTLSAAQKGIGA